MTASTSSVVPSAKRHRRPGAPTARGLQLRRRARRSVARARADQRVASLQPPADPRVDASCGSVPACRATRTGRGRGSAAAAASAASRSRGAPRAWPRAPRRSGSRCCRRRRRARGPSGSVARACGRRCCASGRPRDRGRRRSPAMNGDLERARWRRRPGRPRCARSSSSSRSRRPRSRDDRTAAAELDRQIEVPRVVGRGRRHLVAAGIAVGVAREGQAGKAVVAPRREQLERVPALAPRGADWLGGFEDHEVAALPREEVADRQAGWPAPYCYVVTILSRHVLRSPRSCGVFAATGAPSHSHWAGRWMHAAGAQWNPRVAPFGNAFWRATTRRALGRCAFPRGLEGRDERSAKASFHDDRLGSGDLYA